MKRLLKEMLTEIDPASLNEEANLISTIWEDNQTTITTVEAPKLSPRTKHIAFKHHYTRSQIGKDRGIVLKKIDSLVNKADILTKGLSEEVFQRIILLLCGW